MKDELQALLPDVTIGIAHGQMAGSMLESMMFDFYEGKYDVLLCSSLVENGLDVANANTIIIYDADHFGLSQLYQMRGRVGRSHRMAYAYFLYRRDKVLSEVAEKRLQAIKEFTELGSGLKSPCATLKSAVPATSSAGNSTATSPASALPCTAICWKKPLPRPRPGKR